MRQNVRTILWLALLCGGMSGCQNQSAPVAATPPIKTAPTDRGTSGDAVNPEALPAQAAPPAAPDAPPVAAVRTLLREIDAGRLESLADFLPESYARELESLIRSLVEKTPETLWQRLQAVVIKSATLLQRQPGIVANGSEEQREKVQAALDALAADATWDRTNWKKWDLRTLLQGPASTLLAAWQQGSASNSTLLSQTDLKLLSHEADAAQLELRSVLDSEPRTVEFVRIEERWIPKSLADNWSTNVAQAASRLSQITEAEFAASASRIGTLLLQIEGTLDQMLRAERAEEVQLGWWQIQSLLIQSRQDLLEPGPSPRVEIILSGELSEEHMTDLLEQFLELTDNPASGEYVTFPTATGTAIQLSPVADFAKFVERLNFVMVKSSDAKSRQVEVESAAKN